MKSTLSIPNKFKIKNLPPKYFQDSISLIPLIYRYLHKYSLEKEILEIQDSALLLKSFVSVLSYKAKFKKKLKKKFFSFLSRQASKK